MDIRLGIDVVLPRLNNSASARSGNCFASLSYRGVLSNLAILPLETAATTLQTCAESLAMSGALKRRPFYWTGCGALNIGVTTPPALRLWMEAISRLVNVPGA